MRENRTYGSEGGETGKPVFPTPIKVCLPGNRGMCDHARTPSRAVRPKNRARAFIS